MDSLVDDSIFVQAAPGKVIVRETGQGQFQQAASIGSRHRLVADEPETAGGDDTGPSPFDLLMAGLGACTSMTIRMYARRRELALTGVTVELAHRTEKSTEGHKHPVDVFERVITLEGNLSADERAKLLEIANKCPVHRALTGEVRIETQLVD